MRRRREAVQEQNGGSISYAVFWMKKNKPLHVKRAIENGRRTRICRVFPIHYRVSFFGCHAPLSFSFDFESCSTSLLEHVNCTFVGVRQSPASSRTSANDRFSLDPLGPVEGGNRIVEGSYVAGVCPQPTNPDPLDELAQLGAIWYDDEVDSHASRGACLGRAGDGHQRSSGANHARRALRDVAAEDIENQINLADVFQSVVIEVDELLCAEVESRLTAGSAPGADDVRTGLTCELGYHRTDYAGCTVHEDALPRTKAAVLEQPLPRGQARHHEGRALRKVNVARQGREVARLDGDILRQRAVTNPVREAEHPLSHRQPGRSIAEGGDHSGQLVARDRRRPVTAEAIDPGRGPRQLISGESRRMDLNNDIAVIRAREAGERCPLRLGPLHQLHPGRSRSLIRYHDCFHGNYLL